MEQRGDDLQSAIRDGGAISWPAVAERNHGCLLYALAQPKHRGVATVTGRGLQFTVPVFHFILTTDTSEYVTQLFLLFGNAANS